MDLTTTLILMLLLLQPIVIYFSKQWIENKFKYEFDKSLALFNNDLLIKQRSELIAELVAEWITPNSDTKKLNQLSFQAFLWLPKDIALDLSNTLSHQPEAKNIKDIISEVRVHLIGEQERIDSNEIISFKPFRFPPKI